MLPDIVIRGGEVKKSRWVFMAGKCRVQRGRNFLFWSKCREQTTPFSCVFDLGDAAHSARRRSSLRERYFHQGVNQPPYNAGLMKGRGSGFRPASK